MDPAVCAIVTPIADRIGSDARSYDRFVAGYDLAGGRGLIERPLTPAERIEAVRALAHFAQVQEAIADELFAKAEELSHGEAEPLLKAADAAYEDRERAFLKLIALICGDEEATAECGKIEDRCEAGGF